MKTELEVARDAVRAALGDELADALEWAAAAVRHRETLLSAARWAATEGGPCADCGSAYVHDAKCPTAAMAHALDSEWSAAEVNAAHGFAFEAHFGYGPVDEAVRRGSARALASFVPDGSPLQTAPMPFGLPPATFSGTIVGIQLAAEGPQPGGAGTVALLDDGRRYRLQPAGDGTEWVAVPFDADVGT